MTMTKQNMVPFLSYSLEREYPSVITNDGWGMDYTHVMILYNLLMANPYKRVLEIGSHNGYSTTAFVEALKRGASFEVHLCDIGFMDSVREICRGYDQIKLHQTRSVDYLATAGKFDFALLDGSHIAEDVEDEFEYLSMNGCRSLLLHDTRTQLLPQNRDKPWFDGPLLLKNKLLASPDWMTIEDSASRPGEETERGLLFATRNVDEYHNVVEIFNTNKP